jgi:hypothetical protein
VPLKTPEQILEEVNRLEGRGLAAAAHFLANRIREELSVPAPRVRVLGRRGKMAGVMYYRATTRAIPLAPPRKLSWRLRASIVVEFSKDMKRVRVGINVIYSRRLEQGFPPGKNVHPYLRTVLTRYRAQLERILQRYRK